MGLLTHCPLGWINFPRKSRVSFKYKSTCSSAKKVYISDSGSLILDESEDVLTCDFEEWIENGCSLLEEKTSGTDSCKVILVRMPKGGAKDLLKIK